MELLKKLRIKTKQKDLYIEALTHSSYAHENEVNSYERLEFLGDAVLQLIITEYLYQKFPDDEGVLTKKRAMYVCEQALYNYGQQIGLNKYLKLGKGEISNPDNIRPAIIADAVEALLGAIFLDKGYGYTKKFVYQNIISIIEKDQTEFCKDYKTTFQELVQTEKKSLEYFVLEEKGPAHDRYYKIAVKIDGIVYGIGEGGSKKVAEQEAAKKALEKSNYRFLKK